MGVLAFNPMYFKAFSILVRLVASFSCAGSGTRPLIGNTCSGDVPQVTCGAISAPLNSTTLSNTASASVANVLQ